MTNVERVMLICDKCSLRFRDLKPADIPARGIVCRCGHRLLPHGQRPDPGRRKSLDLLPCEFRGVKLGEVDCQCQGKVPILACAHPANPDGRCVSQKKAGMRETAEYLLPSCRECPFAKQSQEPPGVPQWISEEQLVRDIAKLAAQIPPNVSRIVGIARSGLIPASHLAARLHMPLYALDTARKQLTPCGHGWRLHERREQPGPWLVVDDTQMTGRSLKQAHAVLNSLPVLAGESRPEILYSVVYRNPDLKPFPVPDLWAAELRNPHYLEWNFFNSIFSPHIAVDFDGILCEDWTGGDDSGARYEAFLSTARPLYLPRKAPLPLIVSGRLERWRSPTLDWLTRWGVTVPDLPPTRYAKQKGWGSRSMVHLFPGTTAERNKPHAVSTYKAETYLDYARVLDLKVFVESCPIQAREIAEFSQLPVICPAAAKVWIPGKNL